MQDEKQDMNSKNTKAETKPADYVFALDIGTRSIIGIVGVPQGDMLRIAAVEAVDHPKRAMIDGQIEDIEQVSKVALLVKERLEKRLGYQLKRVCVAAAGRALKTQKADCELTLTQSQVIDEELVSRLEAGAIEAAERQFSPESNDSKHVFYLVGYSVVQYSLDDYPISNLLDHRGQRIGVEVIATFLPREVVDSLYTTMHKIGLDVASLTLEPIAAMNAAIPQNLRLLNLSLVDIGAGTSDIAVSKDGGVVGYTMATVAGDEITEAIMKKYLVDFAGAENIKLKIGEEDDISFKDILGFEHTVTPQDIKREIEPVMRSLCSEIAERIVQVNGASPSAVFLVGGGSKLPGMCACVAECLNLEDNRVAIGGNNFMMNVASTDTDITGPEYATPLGIAISAALNLINDSFSITLNGDRAKLFRSGKLTVLDVLLMNGYSYNQLISRSGQSMVIELNGENKIVYGGHPTAARILLNGSESNISAVIKAGDNLLFEPSIAGADAQPTLKDVMPFEEPFTVTFNHTDFLIAARATVNGKPAPLDQRLYAHDTVKTERISTLGDFIHTYGMSESKPIWVNGQAADSDYKLAAGDILSYAAEKQAAEEPPVPTEPSVPVEPAFVSSDSAPEPVVVPPQDTVFIHLTLNHAPLQLTPLPDKTPYRLIDMLNLVDIDFSKPQGNIILHVNGQDAAYLQALADGDRVDIYWEDA